MVLALVACSSIAGCGGGAAPVDAGTPPATSTARPSQRTDDRTVADRIAYLRVFQEANGRLARDAPRAQQRLLDATDAPSVRAAARGVRDVMSRFAADLARARPPAGTAREHRRVVDRTNELAAAYAPVFDGSTTRTTVGPDASEDAALQRITRLGDLWQADLARLGDAVSRRP